MRSEHLTFPGANGAALAARYEAPDHAPWATALFAHCFTCSKDLKAVRRISRSLVEAGIAVFSFDFTGLGESTGDFADTNFSSNLDDLVAAAAFLEQQYTVPAILVGHSLGGAAVLAVAHQLPSIRAVATIGAPSDPAHLAETLDQAAPDLKQAGEAQVTLAGRRFTVRRQLLDDLRGQRLSGRVAELGRPLMLFHSPVDAVVGVDHARILFEAARHPKSFVSLDRADHLLLDNPADAAFVGRTLAAWLERYVERPTEAALPAPEGQVLVVAGPAGYTNDVSVGRHRLKADEPVSMGGTDEGPGPYDYLLAGLGACTGMTLRMYADRKAWPLEGVAVTLRHDKIHAADCADCETREGKVDRIGRHITLRGPLDAAQRARLMEIADRCPVHRTLTSEIRIETTAEPA